MEYDKQRIASDSRSNFINKLFSWPLETILDENFFKDKIKKIPDTFSSTNEYFDAFVLPLLEEARAELSSSLSKMSGAPFARVVSCKAGRETSSHMYRVTVDHWRTSFSGTENSTYKVLPGDMFVLMESYSAAAPDLQSAQNCVLATVVKLSSNDIDDEISATTIKVRVSQKIDMKFGSSNFLMVFLTNVIHFERIWNALQKRENVKLLEKVLHRHSLDEGNSSGTNPARINELVLDSSTLNTSQRNAISDSIRKVQSNHKFSIGLIWGPPGTGKTKTLATLLCMLQKMNCRTLTCAPTNVAITSLASHTVALLRHSSQTHLRNRFFSLGDILIFGSKERLNVGSEIEDIYLDYRVKKLEEVLSPISGWSCSFSSLLNAFQDFESQIHTFTEQEHVQKSGYINAEQLQSLVQFIQNQFNTMVEPVRRNISTLITHIARTFILEYNIENMISLFDLLQNFETLLLQDAAQLLELHPHSDFFRESITSVLGLLESKSRECASLLRVLFFSLGKLGLPRVLNKDSIMDFCFHMSSLIFCTTSSSLKLFSVPIKPLDVLVIDEAAQLKEAESIIPFQLPGLRHAILAGDEYQLQAMVISHLSISVGFGRSLFQRLGSLGWTKHLLNIQYRMHPSVSAFPRKFFYSNQIIDAPNVKSNTYQKRFLEGSLFGPYSFINISEGQEELDDDGLSRINMVEAAVVREIVLRLCKAWSQSNSNQILSIGVISPYSAQVKTIQKMLGQISEGNFAVNIKSIDGFQGAEEDVILISTVRSNKNGEIGFLSNPQRLNVALTRARYCLWILGNEKTIANTHNFYWTALVTDAKERNCFFNASEDKKISKVVVDVKEKLNQLDDLLKEDSIFFRNATWKVLFSSSFMSSFSQLSSSLTKKYVLTLISNLSNGWRPKKIKVDPSCESSIRIVKQYKVRGLFVVCTNDIVKESEYIQVLKVWDVLPLEEVVGLVRRIDKVYSLYTDDFVRLCKEKCVKGNIEVPLSWSSSCDIVRHKICSNIESQSVSGTSNDIKQGHVKESLFLMKFYSLSSAVVKQLLSGGRELNLPFEVTDNEWEIINYPKSSFVLGRSGTGKTVVLVMKLFQREISYHVAIGGPNEVDDDNNDDSCDDPAIKNERRSAALRQLFVTVNPNLCYSVKQRISDLQSYARGEIVKAKAFNTYMDSTEDFQEIPNSFLEIPVESYPLVVSLKKFLLILDGTVGNSYLHKFLDMKTHVSGNVNSKILMLQIERKEVSYDKFSTSYWPHFNSKLTKNLDPSRVFTEILSCIKGGMQVEQLDQSRLTFESYIQLSDSRRSGLNSSERKVIYDLFLSYERMKHERGEFDLADLVNDLHHRFSHLRYEGEELNFVYVDEVQDLTVRQLALFKYVCKNVEEGFVFAGDTAQTIARGLDFRFEDIRSIFYTKFLQRNTRVKSSTIQDKGGKSCPIFQLSQNFRSHAGILKLAHSVIELVYYFFPNSIDIINPEYSYIDGEPPTLVESVSGKDVLLKIFQDNEKGGKNIVSFGAEQVILVRDESVRNEMPKHVKEHALVLTIFESKGLEFKDALLYNFFSSSSIRENWSVIYEYMQHKNLGSLVPHFPSFNHAKHSGLCLELKQLYVAVTRAKERLWICENNSCYSEPMANYWKTLDRVQVRQFDNSFAQDMVFASSNEEWKLRGFKFLEVSNYETAAICFARAGDDYWEKFSHANGLKTAACRVRGSNSEVSVMLTQAAEIFESIGNSKEAAKCFYDAGEFERAGDIYLKHFKESELNRACHCYRLAGLHARVAKIYAKEGLVSEFLDACNAGKLFELGLQYVRSWKQSELEANIDFITKEQELLKQCAHASYKNHNKKKMMQYVKEFCSRDSMESFLESLGCWDDLIELELEWGNVKKAAKIARKIGNFLLEAELLEKMRYYEDACRLYLWYVFARSFWESGGKHCSKKDFPMTELLLKAEASARKSSSNILEEVCTEIMCLSGQSTGLPELKKNLLVSQKGDNLKWEVIFTRRILEILLKTDISKYEWESNLNLDWKIRAQDMIAEGRVSVDTLMHFWNSWKDKIWTTLEHIDSSKAQNNKYWDFCAHYFGVRKSHSGYFLLYPDAEWAANFTQRSYQTIGTQQLVTAIHHYLCSKLLSTGLNMLEILESLQERFYESLPMIWKCRIRDHVFECAQFLLDPHLRQQSKVPRTALKTYIDDAKQRYVAAVFCMELYKHILQDQSNKRSPTIIQKLRAKVDH